MGWRRFKAELLACLTLQPQRADAEEVSAAVAPLPPAAQGVAAGKAAQVGEDPAAALARKRQATAAAAPPDGLAVLYSGAPGGVEKDVAEYIVEEAKARGLAPAALTAVPLEAAPPLAPPLARRAAVLVCGAADGLDARRSAAMFVGGALPAAPGGGRFKGLSFALLAVGDAASASMQAPRELRQGLLSGGAAELAPMAECNMDEVGEVLEAWAASLWAPLRAALPAGQEGGIKAAPGAVPGPALYSQLGGSDGVAAIFAAWLAKARADWRVRRFLEAAEDEAARAQMGQWLAAALGGPLPYRGPDPAALYASPAAAKGLNSTHLDTLAQHLAGSMADLGHTAGAIDAALEAIARQRSLLNTAA